jgi:hypothetical protein
MKQIVTFLAIAFLAVACEKSSALGSDKQVAGTGHETNGIIGTWKLVAYLEDIGNGTGKWVTPNFTETITFSAEGSFNASPSFPLYSFGYTNYVAKPGLIVFSPATSANVSGDTYQYSIQNSTLVFYPRCREQCMRMYQLIG